MQRFVTVLILIAAVPFAIYVWPTKYAYDHIKIGESQFPVRIHRLTGVAEQLTPAGWLPLKPAPAQAQTDSSGRPVDQSGNPSRTTSTPTPAPARR